MPCRCVLQGSTLLYLTLLKYPTVCSSISELNGIKNRLNLHNRYKSKTMSKGWAMLMGVKRTSTEGPNEGMPYAAKEAQNTACRPYFYYLYKNKPNNGPTMR